MNPTIPVTIAAACLLPLQPLSAALSLYANRGDFNAEHPAAITENFENLNNTTAAFAGPLNSLTSVGGLIEAGDIQPFFSFSSQSNNLFVAASGSSSNPSTAIGSNFPSMDSLQALFASPVHSFAVDLFQNTGAGGQSGVSQSVTITLFDGAATVGSATANVPSGAAGFFGVTSSLPFDRVDIRSDNHLYEVIDNVSVVAVPEPSVALLAAFFPAMLLLRRRMRHSVERLAPAAALVE